MTSGSVYGASFLVVPQFATNSLFSLTDGLAASLSQSDYMSVISLGSESQIIQKDISQFISSLNVEHLVGDALYDIPKRPLTALQQSANLIMYAEQIEALHDHFLSISAHYQSSLVILNSLFEKQEDKSCADHVCSIIMSECKLDGIRLFLNQGNEELIQIVAAALT